MTEAGKRSPMTPQATPARMTHTVTTHTPNTRVTSMMFSAAIMGAAIMGAAIVGAGCGGELTWGQGAPDGADASGDGVDGGDQGSRDQSGSPDMAQAGSDMAQLVPDMTQTGPDMTTPDPCAAVRCGARSVCVQGQCRCEAGYVQGQGGGCVSQDPCEGVMCPRGGICNAGSCACGPGFEGDGSQCTPLSPSDTALRTQQEVCDRWRADHPTQATLQWQVEPADKCDWGVLHPEVVADAQRRLNLYRWLVGLGPIGIAESAQRITQACATTLAATNRGLSHDLDPSYECYSAEAKQGAGSSNLAQGVSHPASSVDLYIQDRGVPSLGHRRWIFNPPMGLTGFGQRGSYSCMYSFDRSVAANPDYVAYPAPGFFPTEGLLGQWSFSSAKYRFTQETTVEIRKVSDGAAVPVSGVNAPGGGYGQPVLAWTVNARDVPLGEELEITIDKLAGNAGATVVYRVTLVSCR